MKKFLTLAIIIPLILVIFNITEVKVIDGTLKTAISGARVNNFTTNKEGIAKFLDLSFNKFLTIERIGYQSMKIALNFKPIFRRIDVELTEADATYVKEQILNWADSLKNYRYILKSTKNNGTYIFTQVIDGNNVYTKTEYIDGSNTQTNEIFVINGRVYSRVNGELKEITENKDDFLTSNLIIVSIRDVISDFFSNVNNSIVFESPDEITFTSPNSPSKLTITISPNGEPSEFSLSLSDSITSILTIDLQNTRVTLNEK